MKRAVFIPLAAMGFIALITLQSCTVDDSASKRVLNGMGITNVRMEGYAWFGCGENDTFRSRFRGVGVNGQPVQGVVCSGFLKGATVRFD